MSFYIHNNKNKNKIIPVKKSHNPLSSKHVSVTSETSCVSPQCAVARPCAGCSYMCHSSYSRSTRDVVTTLIIDVYTTSLLRQSRHANDAPVDTLHALCRILVNSRIPIGLPPIPGVRLFARPRPGSGSRVVPAGYSDPRRRKTVDVPTS